MPSSSHTRNIKSLICLVASFAVLFVINTTFTNCGAVGSLKSVNDNPQMSYDEKVTALKQLHKGQIQIDFCRNPQNYACLYKVFSTSLTQDAAAPPEPVCTQLSDQTEMCVTAQKYFYSTFSAQQNCGENCKTGEPHQFDYEEFECHLKLSLNADGIYPLVASEKDFVASLEKVYRSCVEIQKGNSP